MAVILYNLVILLMQGLYRLAALQNEKARLFMAGRKDFFSKFTHALQNNTQPLIWMHCASLGEFEQGRPVLEALKKEFPAYKILVTFFSPSGYEVRKNYAMADHIFYLPFDTPRHAARFVQTAKPVLALFVKYEFWYHYIQNLRRHNIPLLCVSGVFHEHHIFFRWYGGFFRHMLRGFSHFFVQNQRSADLLKRINITNVTVAGDTRFDRVWELAQQTEPLPLVEQFKADDKLMVVGSCWAEDLNVLLPFINHQHAHTKFIIAPHEISESFIAEIERALKGRCVRYSAAAHALQLQAFQVLIIDNIGMLARLYRYAEYAWVGGAYGKGLHNILEAACYGMPIFFGNRNYKKYPEAVDLINRGGAFEIADYADLKRKFEAVNDPATYLLACEVTKAYVQENRGGTEKIMHYCRKLLRE
jgi:3-deoxy-D-manno-octulosonic-acid transferase